MEIKQGKPHTPFNQILLESIDETLTTLGDANKTALYNGLNAYFYIAKNQIPSKIDTFTKVLKAVFGNAFPASRKNHHKTRRKQNRHLDPSFGSSRQFTVQSQVYPK